MLNRTLSAALAAMLTLAATAAVAQQATPDEDPVVARVNGEEILRSTVFEFAQALPPQYQAQLAQLYPLLVQRLVDFRLASNAARAAGLVDDDEVKRRLAAAEDRVIRDVYLERQIDSRVTDDGVKAKYDEHIAANPPATEHRARHILVETEEAARDIIAKLDGGADFAELAKELSTGPSGPQGGDLGYFTADQMVPEFAQAASAMEPGQYSKDPTQTQFGWHVIKVEDRRQAAPPPFEQLEQQLREELARTAMETVLIELREGAEVEILPAGASLAAGTADTQ